MNRICIVPFKYQSLKKCLNDPYIGELLFIVGYTVFLGKFVWDSTMFPFPPVLHRVCLLITISCIGLKIILYDKYEFSTLLGIAGIVLTSVAVFVFGRYSDPIYWIFLVMGGKDVSFRRVLKVYFVVTSTIVFLAFVASLIGVIENLQYITSDQRVRSSFGIVYVTDFAAYIFFLVLVFFFLKGNNLKLVHLGSTIFISGLIYYFCLARVDCMCILLVALTYGTQRLLNHVKYGFERLRYFWNGFWDKLGIFILPFWAVVSIGVTLGYNEEIGIYKRINTLLSGRLELGYQGFKDYGVTLFGQPIEMIGLGGTTIKPEEYFFIDCSYINILLRYGLCFFCILILVYVIMCCKYKYNIYFLMAIALIATNCVIAHHIMDVAYNPFIYGLLMKQDSA